MVCEDGPDGSVQLLPPAEEEAALLAGKMPLTMLLPLPLPLLWVVRWWPERWPPLEGTPDKAPFPPLQTGGHTCLMVTKIKIHYTKSKLMLIMPGLNGARLSR